MRVLMLIPLLLAFFLQSITSIAIEPDSYLTEYQVEKISAQIHKSNTIESLNRDELNILKEQKYLEVESYFYEVLWLSLWMDNIDIFFPRTAISYIFKYGTQSTAEHRDLLHMIEEQLKTPPHWMDQTIQKELIAALSTARKRRAILPSIKDVKLDRSNIALIFEANGDKILNYYLDKNLYPLTVIEYLVLAATSETEPYRMSRSEALTKISQKQIRHPLLYTFLINSLMSRRAQRFDFLMEIFLSSYPHRGQDINTIISWSSSEPKIKKIYLESLINMSQKIPSIVDSIRQGRKTHSSETVVQAKYENLPLEEWLEKQLGHSSCSSHLLDRSKKN